jgi:hypothetical protein
VCKTVRFMFVMFCCIIVKRHIYREKLSHLLSFFCASFLLIPSSHVLSILFYKCFSRWWYYIYILISSDCCWMLRVLKVWNCQKVCEMNEIILLLSYSGPVKILISLLMMRFSSFQPTNNTYSSQYIYIG